MSCVLFSPSEEILVWSAGKDGKVKQWDAKKHRRVQTMDRHTADVRALAQSVSGTLLVSGMFLNHNNCFQFSASHDRSIRCWELSEEIIVLDEEEEMEREREYEDKLLEEEDVVPGESNENEAGLAATRSAHTIVSVW